MGLKLYLTALLAAIPLSQCHFAFVRVALNGEWQDPTRFIRNKTEHFEEEWTPNTNVNWRAYTDPTYATDYPESVRCGRDNMRHAADTEVLKVRGGDFIEVAHTRPGPENWSEVVWNNCPYERGSCMNFTGDTELKIMDLNHPGPFIAHLSRVPEGEDIHTYDGSGDWVKIYTLGMDMTDDVINPIHWLPWNGDRYENGSYRLPSRIAFNIPKQTPKGQYLLRFDLVNTGVIQPGFTEFPAQLYATCAQIQVESDGESEALPKGVLIPEALSHFAPGMTTTLTMYRSESLDTDYVYPGGPLWNGVNYVQDKPVTGVDG
ncbi:glycosyl hydrolase family 61-domain-containing protein [Xylaria scruposa]|nr:glycosyl hydrolase family 61-domain-containing protein [Xylaria scruposa]